MVAGHEAHLAAGLAQGAQPGLGQRVLARQREVEDVAGHGDMVRLLVAQVSHDGGQHLHVVRIGATAFPVDVAGDALADKIAAPGMRQRSDMGVGQMGESEGQTRLAARRAEATPEARNIASRPRLSMTPLSGGIDPEAADEAGEALGLGC